MNKDEVIQLKTFIEIGMSPILLEDVPAKLFSHSVILNADCDISELNGHYEGTEFVAPQWYQDLIKEAEDDKAILIINDLHKISVDDQVKFIELLKYRKISTFKLPEKCIIIVTFDNLDGNNKINEEVYSLLIHVDEFDYDD